tara:strand:- start:755 stop:988 length:234 start_codon:yes stop_codon:yes gene_type:complete
MNRIIYYFIPTAFLFASGDTISRMILFALFIILGAVGYKFIRLRTGNYDVDYFTKPLGWLLMILAVWGVLESLKIIQ